ncbi:hypothetical protein H0H93_009366 [Arthromyces matolae]|nr:hypothetical protein H0H93_009366 [Arthromyces matolae]
MADESLEGKLLSSFERFDEFFKLQQSCLDFDLYETPSNEQDKKEYLQFKQLSDILDEYQEQSYLLDPHLEAMVMPVANALRSHAKSSVHTQQRGSESRVERLSSLLYSYVKCRGYKTISQCVVIKEKHIGDTKRTLDFLLLPNGLIQDSVQWALRYVVLIWLSLICMIPFDLAQFDETGQHEYTASMIESSAKKFLGKAGLERESAAMLLSRLYMRRDMTQRFRYFVDSAQTQFRDGSTDLFTALGVLQAICEVVKSGPSEQIQQESSSLILLVEALDAHRLFSSNTAIRKYRTKLLSRIGIRLLPGSNVSRRKGEYQSVSRFTTPDILHYTGRLLTGEEASTEISQHDELEVPADVENILEDLFSALQDKDTIVRWSAAKGVARISERLPTDFSDQIMETILNLFSVHSIAAASLYDLPAIAESTWHGACLACAEMTRRGLVAQARLPALIEWLSKALYFDLRKGAHSIGSNVRDAAAYVIWALARSQDPTSLRPFSLGLAQRLTAVALYDREIHIRRAASAAFQEHVGRNSLFPHGIDVLGKTDFFSVSVRRNAFLTAASQVAQHEEYTSFLLNHVLDVTLRHWDAALRELGSQSLRFISLQDLGTFGSVAIDKSARLLESLDVSDLHGGLLALSEMAIAYRGIGGELGQGQMRKIFRCLSNIPSAVVVGPRNAVVTATACRLISITLSQPELQTETTSVPHWRDIIDYGLKHRLTSVQEAAANAMASVSRLVDSSDTIYVGSIFTVIHELKRGSQSSQQSLGIFLGAIDYSAHDNALSLAIESLLQFVDDALTPPDLLADLTESVIASIFQSLLHGLDDYSIDQRGDVGSWIRVACMQSLTTTIEVLMHNARTSAALHTYLPPSIIRSAVSGILKQGVERLDNVRQAAGECFLRLLYLPLPEVQNATAWQLPGSLLLMDLFGRYEQESG